MPKVKGKKFPYSKEGIKAAKEYAESDARGRSERYQWGGMVLPQQGRRPMAPVAPPVMGGGMNPLGRGRGMYKEGGEVKKYKKGGKAKK